VQTIIDSELLDFAGILLLNTEKLQIWKKEPTSQISDTKTTINSTKAHTKSFSRAASANDRQNQAQELSKALANDFLL
jgi:hypothetical protein